MEIITHFPIIVPPQIRVYICTTFGKQVGSSVYYAMLQIDCHHRFVLHLRPLIIRYRIEKAKTIRLSQVEFLLRLRAVPPPPQRVRFICPFGHRPPSSQSATYPHANEKLVNSSDDPSYEQECKYEKHCRNASLPSSCGSGRQR